VGRRLKPPLSSSALTRWNIVGATGLLAALDRWVREGVAPPPSLHPMPGGSHRSAADEITISQRAWSAMALSRAGRISQRYEWLDPQQVLAVLGSAGQIRTGNVISGFACPSKACRWEPTADGRSAAKLRPVRHAVSMSGSYIPFAKTKAEREKAGDPRLSLENGTAAGATRASRRGVGEKIGSGTLPCFKKTYADRRGAGQHWDWTMTRHDREPQVRRGTGNFKHTCGLPSAIGLFLVFRRVRTLLMWSPRDGGYASLARHLRNLN